MTLDDPVVVRDEWARPERLAEPVRGEPCVAVVALGPSPAMVDLGYEEPHVASHTYGRVNGEASFAGRFRRVERPDVDTAVVFPHGESVRADAASLVTRARLADSAPALHGTVPATRPVSVFVADTA